MIGTDLKVGDWAKFEYDGKPRVGQVEQKEYGRYSYVHDGWLVKTGEGYRHFKIHKMRNVELVR